MIEATDDTKTATGVYALAHEYAKTLPIPNIRVLTDWLLENTDPGVLAAAGARAISASTLHSMRRPAARAIDKTIKRSGGGEFDLASVSIYDGTKHVWLLECDEGFLRRAVDYHRGQARDLNDVAASYERVAALFKGRAHAATVRDLPSALVAAAIEGRPENGASQGRG